MAVNFDINGSVKTVVRAVNITSSVVPYTTFSTLNNKFNSLTISRVLWTGNNWTITSGGVVVLNLGSAPWGVLDFGERGTVIPLGNTDFTIACSGANNTLILEINKSSSAP